jgi:hypothetical protein
VKQNSPWYMLYIQHKIGDIETIEKERKKEIIKKRMENRPKRYANQKEYNELKKEALSLREKFKTMTQVRDEMIKTRGAAPCLDWFYRIKIKQNKK